MPSLSSPLFVIGNPRSGTSLFRLLLTSHSKVIIPPECGFIIWLYSKFRNWSRDYTEEALDFFISELGQCKKFDTWEIELDGLKQYLNDKRPVNYAALCSYVYEYYSLKFSKHIEIWGDKNNFYLNHIGDLYELYPSAKFIHLVRDGRDVYCSYKNVMKNKARSPYAPQLSTDIRAVADEWNKNLTQVDDFFKKRPLIRYKTVRYEDLIDKAEIVLSDVFSWCGLTYEDSVLNFYNNNLIHKLEPEKTMEWKLKTIEPIDPNNSGNYKNLMSTNEIGLFNATAAQALLRFGYL